LTVTDKSNFHLGKVPLQPAGLVYGLCQSPRHDDHKGKWSDHPGKGQRELALSLTTEKMLSANSKMSNIFLQRGQNIDITHKNRLPGFINFGSLERLTFYLD
jgi:hypothetical protein